MTTELALVPPTPSEAAFDLVPRSLQEAMQLSELIAKSHFIPKEYQNQPADVLVAVQFGHELGLKPLQALQSIACINGKPAVYGDAMLGIVQKSPVYEWIDESESSPTTGVSVVKRRGHEAVRSVFTLDDARRAGLIDKPGPWKQYTARMLKLRARGFALRDAFSDVLKGMISTEEAMDLPSVHIENAVIGGGVSGSSHPLTLNDKLKAKLEETRLVDKPVDKAAPPQSVAEVAPSNQDSTGALAEHAGAAVPTPDEQNDADRLTVLADYQVFLKNAPTATDGSTKLKEAEDTGLFLDKELKTLRAILNGRMAELGKRKA